MLISGVYGMTSLYTLSWGVPVFIVGLFLTISLSIVFIAKLVNGQGPATGVMGQMKNLLGTANQDLFGRGIPSTAVVTGMRDTGTAVNDQVVVAFDLLVQPTGGTPYAVSHRQILPRLLMGAVLPGKAVQVWSDPADPQRLVIDWNTLPAQPA
jgi:hypothetical protein